MTTLSKLHANRDNAQLSTGPRTTTGKALAKMNAVSHGLRSVSPVLPGELPQDWEVHRAGIVAALAPVGVLEAELAERVALLTWRLRRVVAYETAVASAEISRAESRCGSNRGLPHQLRFLPSGQARSRATVEQELRNCRDSLAAVEANLEALQALTQQDDDTHLMPDAAYSLLLELTGCVPGAEVETFDLGHPDALARIGVPAAWHNSPRRWPDWTAGAVRKGLALIAGEFRLTPAALVSRAERLFAESLAERRQEVQRLEDELAHIREGSGTNAASLRAENAIPDSGPLDKVMRYESHLNRQLAQTLHLLERLQAIRDDSPHARPTAVSMALETDSAQ